MYKFGEFDSYQEINAAAEGFLNEGDIESLKSMAEENGLDPEDVQDYLDGELTELATCSTAALGRLRTEQQAIAGEKELSKRLALQVILALTWNFCTDPQLAHAIMRKGKHLTDIYEAMKAEALAHTKGANRMGISCGTDRQLEDIIRTYYLEPECLKQHLEALYQEV